MCVQTPPLKMEKKESPIVKGINTKGLKISQGQVPGEPLSTVLWRKTKGGGGGGRGRGGGKRRGVPDVLKVNIINVTTPKKVAQK